MKVSEAFLVNTKNFDVIIDTLVGLNTEGLTINSTLLENLGFSDPNDLLVVRILKDFNIIDNNGKAGEYFNEFSNPATTNRALAKGLVTAYGQLFDKYPKIHHASLDKIKEAFEEIFEGKKTELIIKYISGTFQKVSSYAGLATVDSILQKESLDLVQESVAMEAEVLQPDKRNGTHNTSEKQSDLSNKNIDDLINDFDEKRFGDNSDDTKEADLTVHEYSKENEPVEDDDDPFNFEDEFSSKPPKPTAKKEQIDMDPVDLDISLSTATQPSDPMKNKTAEHEFVQKALIRKSDLLLKMQRWEELVPALEEIIRRYDNNNHPGLDEAVSRSIIRRAIALLKLHRTDEALSALSSVIIRFKDSENKEFFDQASRAMLYKANILEKNGTEDLLPLYNSIIERLDTNSELVTKEKLDEIHLKRFDLIISKGESSEIFEASTKLIRRFKDSDEHQTYLQKAMIIRAEMLDDMGHEEEALAAYNQFLANFAN